MKGLNYKFKSGKFIDKTVKEVCEINPDYILFLHASKDINISFQFNVLQKAFQWQNLLK